MEPVNSRISVFRGEYAFLSNFYETPVHFQGLTYRNSEAAFQAVKCFYEEERKNFINLNATEAKRRGRSVKLRPDWENVKLSLMYDILTAKFSDPELKRKLLNTGTAELIEGNNWGDRYWGVSHNGSGTGENHLGILLMRVRDKYAKEEMAYPKDLICPNGFHLLAGSLYRHFKGNRYRLNSIALHTETGEKLAVYCDEASGQVWARPLDMFCSEIDQSKYPGVKQKYRFELIQE